MKVCECCYLNQGKSAKEAAECPFVCDGWPTVEVPDPVQDGDMNQEIEEFQSAMGRVAVQATGGMEGGLGLPPNPKQVYGDKKVPLHLVPPAANVYLGMALGEGGAKYGPYNWRGSKVEAMTYIGAALRHIAAWVDGEDIDPDSTTGKPHLAGALASLAILVDAIEGGFVIDNRPPPGPAPRLIRPMARGLAKESNQ